MNPLDHWISHRSVFICDLPNVYNFTMRPEKQHASIQPTSPLHWPTLHDRYVWHAPIIGLLCPIRVVFIIALVNGALLVQKNFQLCRLDTFDFWEPHSFFSRFIFLIHVKHYQKTLKHDAFFELIPNRLNLFPWLFCTSIFYILVIIRIQLHKQIYFQNRKRKIFNVSSPATF